MRRYQNIKESPDTVVTDSSKYGYLSWADSDAYAFAIYEDEFLIGKHITHGQLNAFSSRNINKIKRSELIYPGRLWTDSRVISFWEYPKSISELKKIATFISMKIGVNIMSPKWMIEINIKGAFGSKLIPILDFDKSDELSASEKAKQHVVSPMLKKKVAVPSGVGSKHKKYDTPINMRYKMNREHVQLLKKLIREASGLDLQYIAKRLSDYKRGIIDFESLVEGISIDLVIKKYPTRVAVLEDHLSATVDELHSKKDIVEAAKEILSMKF